MEIHLVLKQVDVNFNFTRLAEIIMAEEKYFDKFGTVIDTDNGPIVFKDNGAKILAVAHIDTAVKVPFFNGLFYADLGLTKTNRFDPVKPCYAYPQKTSKKNKKAFAKLKQPVVKKEDATLIVAASGLDDRLGVFTILELLPQLGIECDVMLTTNEERGASTARGFQEHVAKKYNKEYNWFVEFDRRAEDCVTYRYKTDEFTAALKDVEFDLGMGSYTDICDMSQHQVCGLNVGVGYFNAHSKDSWFSVDMLFRNLDRFITFYNKYKDTKFEIDTSKWHQRKQWKSWGYNEGYVPVYQQDVRTGKWWKENKGETYGEKYAYVWFLCPYCRTMHNDIEKGDNIECKCGTQFRRSLYEGDIYKYDRRLLRYDLVLKINKYHLSTAKDNKMMWQECDICSSMSASGMRKIDGRTVCSRCITLFSQCEWCEKYFFSLGQKDVTLCEDCNEIFIIYGGETTENRNAET